MNNNHQARFVTRVSSHESSRWGGQSTTTSLGIQFSFLGEDRDLVWVRSENPRDGHLSEMFPLPEEVTTPVPGRIPCGRDSEGFYVVERRHESDGEEISPELAGRLSSLVEESLRRREGQFREEMAALTTQGKVAKMITLAKTFSERADELCELFHNLRTVHEQKVFAKNIYCA